MRGGKKSLNLYRELSEKIKSGHLVCGDQFPPENEMAVQYGVSCGTIRKALSMLLADGVIERTKRKGTFVTDPKPQTPITILLPCPDYLSYRNFSTHSLLAIMEGAMRAAAAHNVRVETVPAGIDTDPENINWANLDFITSESRVILYGLWYSKIFPFLRERRCSVAFCHNQTRPDLQATAGSHWNMFVLDTRTNALQSAEHMLKQNCRRIACHCTSLHEEGHPFVGGYLDALEKHGIEVEPALIFNDIRQAGALQQEFGFDGILVDDLEFSPQEYENFHRTINITPQTLVGFRHNWTLMQLQQQTSTGKFDLVRIGAEMAGSLLANRQSQNTVYRPELMTMPAKHRGRILNKTIESHHHLNT